MSTLYDRADPSDRRRFLLSINPRMVGTDMGESLRDLFAVEVNFRHALWTGEAEDPDLCYENLYHCALLLHALGDVNDVPALWRAKRMNMDTSTGMEIEYLLGAGVAATTSYVQEHGLYDILAYQEIASFTDEHLAEWFEMTIQYHCGSNS